ncbi:MAG: OmpH family outer membrane protein [Chitinophagaceae bacterium]|nr:MAG: OmpH family outer membrane protein [Chitinophagaceae bacterium]
MKHFSTILNVVLLAAVAFLYFNEFGSSKSKKTNAATVITSKSGVASAAAPIAYVELDSLNEKITFIKDKRKELEAEQRAIENEWESGYRGLENQKNEFIKKGDAITQQMAEEFQGRLLSQQQRVDEKKQLATQKLSEKSYRFMDDIQKKLKLFLIDYNKDKNYPYILTTGTGLDYMVYKDSTLNITADVIEGMNELLKKK